LPTFSPSLHDYGRRDKFFGRQEGRGNIFERGLRTFSVGLFPFLYIGVSVDKGNDVIKVVNRDCHVVLHKVKGFLAMTIGAGAPLKRPALDYKEVCKGEGE